MLLPFTAPFSFQVNFFNAVHRDHLTCITANLEELRVLKILFPKYKDIAINVTHTSREEMAKFNFSDEECFANEPNKQTCKTQTREQQPQEHELSKEENENAKAATEQQSDSADSRDDSSIEGKSEPQGNNSDASKPVERTEPRLEKTRQEPSKICVTCGKEIEDDNYRKIVSISFHSVFIPFLSTLSKYF